MPYLKSFLRPLFQPIVRVSDLSVSHYECLARVRRDASRHAHVQVLEGARDNGVIVRLDHLMLSYGVRGIERDMHVAVNVSQDTILTDCERYLAHLAQIPADHRRRLVIEITETPAQGRLTHGCSDKVISFASALHELNIALALDDVGEGIFSHISPEFVTAVSPKFIKLSSRLAQEIDKGHAQTLLPIIEHARATGISIIAEGISTPFALAVASTYADYVQGYLFGHRPAHADRIEVCE